MRVSLCANVRVCVCERTCACARAQTYQDERVGHECNERRVVVEVLVRELGVQRAVLVVARNGPSSDLRHQWRGNKATKGEVSWTWGENWSCLLYTSPSPRDGLLS
eukprot:3250120-Pleurochrysis_carterae.AAC.2